MIETLQDFIARRRRELDQEESKLREKLAEILAERKGLDQAEMATFGRRTFQEEVCKTRRAKKTGIKPGTIMFDVMNILEHYSEGLNANQILNILNSRRDAYFLARTSLSPQLSRLKQAGYIELEGSIWRLAASKQKEP